MLLKEIDVDEFVKSLTDFAVKHGVFSTLVGGLIGAGAWIFNLYLQLAEANIRKKNDEEKIEGLNTRIQRLEEMTAVQAKQFNDENSKAAVLAKYKFNSNGVPIHISTNRAYCPACLLTAAVEVPMRDEERDELWRCTVNRDHYFKKPNFARPRPTDSGWDMLT